LGLTPVDSDVHCHTDLPCRGSGGPPADVGYRVPVMIFVKWHALDSAAQRAWADGPVGALTSSLVRVLCSQAGIADGGGRWWQVIIPSCA